MAAAPVSLGACSTLSVYVDQNPNVPIAAAQTSTWDHGTLPDDGDYPGLSSQFVCGELLLSDLPADVLRVFQSNRAALARPPPSGIRELQIGSGGHGSPTTSVLG